MSSNEKRKTKSLFSYIHPLRLILSSGSAVFMHIPMNIVMICVIQNLYCLNFVSKCVILFLLFTYFNISITFDSFDTYFYIIYSIC